MLRLPVSTFSPFRTVQHLQRVLEHGSCHGRADGCDEAFMLGDMIKGTLCKLVTYAFEEKQSTGCGVNSVFWNAESNLVNHDSRSVSRKLQHLTCDFSFKHIIIMDGCDSQSYCHRTYCVRRISLLRKTRRQGSVTSFHNGVSAPESN